MKRNILLFLILSVVFISACTSTPVVKSETVGKPEIQVDGYTDGYYKTQDPTPVTVHISADNIGDADAKEVRVGINFCSQDNLFCYEGVSLGSIKAHDHTTKTTVVSCDFPDSATQENTKFDIEIIQVRT